MKKYIWILVALLTLTACSSDDNNEEKENIVGKLTPELLAGLWVADYAQSATEDGKTWTRVVDAYQFNANGTGYNDLYLLDGDKLVSAESVRDKDKTHYTISGNTVNVTLDNSIMEWTLTYADGKLTDIEEGIVYQKATTEQQTLVNQLYADWQGMNSGEEEEEEVQDLNDVDGNVDLNNGGGGVNEVR